MPASPWQKRQPIDPAGSYVVMYTRLPLQRSRASSAKPSGSAASWRRHPGSSGTR